MCQVRIEVYLIDKKIHQSRLIMVVLTHGKETLLNLNFSFLLTDDRRQMLVLFFGSSHWIVSTKSIDFYMDRKDLRWYNIAVNINYR